MTLGEVQMIRPVRVDTWIETVLRKYCWQTAGNEGFGVAVIVIVESTWRHEWKFSL